MHSFEIDPKWELRSLEELKVSLGHLSDIFRIDSPYFNLARSIEEQIRAEIRRRGINPITFEPLEADDLERQPGTDLAVDSHAD
ncbi:MAG: hypothetical protein F4Z28_18045 [Gammaproteobacteria bacterium]|nr:hypothetical protein [Gammaproteobacteria bacterium]